MSDEVARDHEIGSKLQLNFNLEPSAQSLRITNKKALARS